tara:strand:+ start:8883 stop:10235 length:1353 start_codon:yes stop_codon:yes gene_type:complete
MATEIKTLKNGNSIEITTIVGDLSVQTLNPGFDNEKFNFIFSGRAVKNKPTKIATLKLSNTNTNKKLNLSEFKKQIINTVKSKVQLKFVSSTLDANGNKESINFDIIYTSKGETLKKDNLIYDLISSNFDVPTVKTGISSVFYGTDTISQDGEVREIKLSGVPKTTSFITVTRLQDSLDSSGNILTTINENFNKSFINSTHKLQSGSILKGASIIIGSEGRVSVFVNFPKVTTKTRYAIHVLSSSLSTNFATNNNFLSSLEANNSTPGLGIDNFSTKILEQNVNPTLTFRATTTESAGVVKLTVNGGADQTFNSSASVDKVYNGKFNSSEGLTSFTITYVMTALSGAFSARSGAGGAVTFTNSLGDEETTENTLGAALFSNIEQSSSDWTNSIASKNGGTNLQIIKISQAVSTVSSSNDTLTISFSVIVNNWGTKNTIMALALNTLIARS